MLGAVALVAGTLVGGQLAVGAVLDRGALADAVPRTSLSPYSDGAFTVRAAAVDSRVDIAGAEDGSYVLGHTPAGSDVVLDLDLLSGDTARPWWVQPATGTTLELARLASSGIARFPAPQGPDGSRDWVLVVDDVAAGYGAPDADAVARAVGERVRSTAARAGSGRGGGADGSGSDGSDGSAGAPDPAGASGGSGDGHSSGGSAGDGPASGSEPEDRDFRGSGGGGAPPGGNGGSSDGDDSAEDGSGGSGGDRSGGDEGRGYTGDKGVGGDETRGDAPDEDRGTGGGGGAAAPPAPAAPAAPAPKPETKKEPAPSSSAKAADGTWDELAQCESSGDWSISTGNGYHGGLQFDKGTWSDFGGTTYAPTADGATKEQQIEIATKVRDARGGYGSWPACANKLGLPR